MFPETRPAAHLHSRLVRLSLLPIAVLAIVLGVTVSQSLSASHPKAPAQVDPLTKVGLASPSGHAGAAARETPSGVSMPVGNLRGWKQIFRYDFSEPVALGGFSHCVDRSTIMASTCSGLPRSVAAKLWAYPDGWPDHHTGTYEPSKVLSIHNGVLDYYLHTQGRTPMVAAVEPKIPGGVHGDGSRYGAFVIRFRATQAPGYKTAFLLWPDSERWPADGEIDFPEGNLDSDMTAAMHFQGGTSLESQDLYATSTGYAGWHTAVIEWTPTRCRFILDGRIIGTSSSLIPDTPMHWVLQAETVNGPRPPANAAAHIYVAWITAYRRT